MFNFKRDELEEEQSNHFKPPKMASQLEDVVSILKATYRYNTIHGLYHKLGIEIEVDTTLDNSFCYRGKGVKVVLCDSDLRASEFYLACLLGHSILHNVNGGEYNVGEATYLEEAEACEFGNVLYLDGTILYPYFKEEYDKSETIEELIYNMSTIFKVSEEIMYNRLYELSYIRYD